MELMFLLLTLIPEALGNLCTGRQSAVIHHPQSCKKFIVCQDEEPTEMVCPGDLYFDIIIRSCILHSLAHCGITYSRMTTAPLPYWTRTPSTIAIPTFSTSLESLPPIVKSSTYTEIWLSLPPMPTEKPYTTEVKPSALPPLFTSRPYPYPTNSQYSVSSTPISSNLTDSVTNIPTMSPSYSYSSETITESTLSDGLPSLLPSFKTNLPKIITDSETSTLLPTTMESSSNNFETTSYRTSLSPDYTNTNSSTHSNPISETTENISLSPTSITQASPKETSSTLYVNDSTTTETDVYRPSPLIEISTVSPTKDSSATTLISPPIPINVVTEPFTELPIKAIETTYNTDVVTPVNALSTVTNPLFTKTNSGPTLTPTSFKTLPPITTNQPSTRIWISLPTAPVSTSTGATDGPPSALPPISTLGPYPHSESSESTTSNHVETTTSQSEYTISDDKFPLIPSTISSKITPVPISSTEVVNSTDHTNQPSGTPTIVNSLPPITTNPTSTIRWVSLPTALVSASSTSTEGAPSSLPPLSTQKSYPYSIPSGSTPSNHVVTTPSTMSSISYDKYTTSDDKSTLIYSTSSDEPKESSPTYESTYIDSSTISATNTAPPSILSTKQTGVHTKESTLIQPNEFPPTSSNTISPDSTSNTETTYSSDYTSLSTLTTNGFEPLPPILSTPTPTNTWVSLPSVTTTKISRATEVDPSPLPPFPTSEPYPQNTSSDSTSDRIITTTSMVHTSQGKYTTSDITYPTLLPSTNSNEPKDSAPTTKSPLYTSTIPFTYTEVPTVLSSEHSDVHNIETTKFEPYDYSLRSSSTNTPFSTSRIKTTYSSDYTNQPTQTPTIPNSLPPITTNPTSTVRWVSLPTAPVSSRSTEGTPSSLPPISTQKPYPYSIPSGSTTLNHVLTSTPTIGSTSNGSYTASDEKSTLIYSTSSDEPKESSPTSESSYIGSFTISATNTAPPSILSTKQTEANTKETNKIEPYDSPSTSSNTINPFPTSRIETTYSSDYTGLPTLTPTGFEPLPPILSTPSPTDTWVSLPSITTTKISKATEVDPSALPPIPTSEPQNTSSESTSDHVITITSIVHTSQGKYLTSDVTYPTLLPSTNSNESVDSSPANKSLLYTSTIPVTNTAVPTILSSEPSDVHSIETTKIEPTNFSPTVSSSFTPISTSRIKTTYSSDYTHQPTRTSTISNNLPSITTNPTSTVRWVSLPTAPVSSSSTYGTLSSLPPISTQEPYPYSIETTSESTPSNHVLTTTSTMSSISYDKYTTSDDKSTLIYSTSPDEFKDSLPTSESPYIDSSTISLINTALPTILSTKQTDVHTKESTLIQPNDFPSTSSNTISPDSTSNTETTYSRDYTSLSTLTTNGFEPLPPILSTPTPTNTWVSLPSVTTTKISKATEVDPSPLPPFPTSEPYPQNTSSDSTSDRVITTTSMVHTSQGKYTTSDITYPTLLPSTNSNEPKDSAPTNKSPLYTSTIPVTYTEVPTILNSIPNDVHNVGTTRFEPYDYSSRNSSTNTPFSTSRIKTTYSSDYTNQPTQTPTIPNSLPPITTNPTSTVRWVSLPTAPVSSRSTEGTPSSLPPISTQEPYPYSIPSGSTPSNHVVTTSSTMSSISYDKYTTSDYKSTLIYSTSSDEPKESSPTYESTYIDSSTISATNTAPSSILSTKQTEVNTKETDKIEPYDSPSTSANTINPFPTSRIETTYSSDYTSLPTLTPTGFEPLPPILSTPSPTDTWVSLPSITTTKISKATEVDPSALPPIPTSQSYPQNISSDSTSDRVITSTFIVHTSQGKYTTSDVTYPTLFPSTKSNEPVDSSPTNKSPLYTSTIPVTNTAVPTILSSEPSDVHGIDTTKIVPTNFSSTVSNNFTPISTFRVETTYSSQHKCPLCDLTTQKSSASQSGEATFSPMTNETQFTTSLISTPVSLSSVTIKDVKLHTTPISDNIISAETSTSIKSVTDSEISSVEPAILSSEHSRFPYIETTKIDTNDISTSQNPVSPLHTSALPASTDATTSFFMTSEPIIDVESPTKPVMLPTLSSAPKDITSTTSELIHSSMSTASIDTNSTNSITDELTYSVSNEPSTLGTDSNTYTNKLSPITPASSSSASVTPDSSEVTFTAPTPVISSSHTAILLPIIQTNSSSEENLLPPIPKAQTEAPSPLPPLPIHKMSTLPPQTTTEIPPAPVVCRPYRYYTVVNPESTKTFYYCVLGTRYLFKCPHSYEFDPKTHVCEDPDFR